MYFDAVLDMDDGMKPLFNGTPEDTVAWLKEQKFPDDLLIKVCLGRTMSLMTIFEYLYMYS